MLSSYNYSIDEVNLSKPEMVKDLGVVFDPKLNFGRHFEMITNNAYRNLGYIYRFSNDLLHLDSTLLKLYYSYVRSQLEYSCIIWTPNTQKYVKAIEKIQCKFLKSLMYRKTLYPAYVPYRELVSNFNIHTLERRRHLNDLIFLYKLIHNQIDCIDLIPKNFHSSPEH